VVEIIPGGNEIRGKETSKTDQTLDYLVGHANQVYSAAEIAEALEIDQSVVTTILNRLSLEGTIMKEERGKFAYASKIEPETAERIYRKMQKTLNAAIGSEITAQILKDSGFKSDDPIKSLDSLLATLSKAFGKATTDNMMLITVRSEFDPASAEMIMKELSVLQSGGT
jgi:predicted transcriptional regulator